MKIIYNIAGTYRPAGMERVLAVKASWLTRRGHEVVVVTTEQCGREAAFPMEGVRQVDLGIGYEQNNGGSFVDKLVHYPRKRMLHRKRLEAFLMAEKADVVVSMACGEERFLPRIKDGSRKVLEVHFSRFKRLQYGREGLWALADRMRSGADVRAAAAFDRFVVLTSEDASYWGKLPNIKVIPNPRTFTFDAPSSLDAHQVLAVGRYTHQKGFDRLIEAWKMMDTEGWTLRIAGEGDSLGELPSNVVTGISLDMRQEYLSSSILALSSRYEGLPMVLLEAQAAGLPAVCFTCKCGPRDVITDGVDGILVEEGDIKGLAEGLEKLMRDKDLRKRMGAAAYSASEKYDEEKIMQQWQTLFEGLL